MKFVGHVDQPAGSITFHTNGHTEVLRLTPEGDVVWRGRKVEGDDEFRAAMMDLRKVLVPAPVNGFVGVERMLGAPQALKVRLNHEPSDQDMQEVYRRLAR